VPYKGVGFDMPTSPGSFVIGDLGFTPQGAVFMGGNQTAEDVVTSPSNAGAFFGMAWLDAVSGLIDQQALGSMAPQGFHFYPAAISMCGGSSGATIDYRAVVTSFDDDSITLNVTHAASGNRPIHCLIWGDFDGAHGSTGVSFDNAQVNFDVGYRAGTGLMFHFFPTGGVRDRQGNGGNWFSMGVGNWPIDEDPPPYGPQTQAGASAIRLFSALGSVGYTQQLLNHFGPGHTSLSLRPWVAGSYLTAYDLLYPYPGWPGGDETKVRMEMWGYTTRHSAAWWTGEGSVEFVGTPDNGDTDVHTANANVEEVEAVLFFGTTGYGTEAQGNPPCAYIFGVLTEDYQGCVTYDLGIGGAPTDGTPRFFQSTQHCYADNMYEGVRTASGEIVGNEVHMTGEQENSSSEGRSSFMQMYGGEVDQPDMWLMEV
jgi:hypothetical protein